MRLQQFWDRVGFTIIGLLMGVFFLPHICWGGIQIVTSITPGTAMTYSTQDEEILK